MTLLRPFGLLSVLVLAACVPATAPQPAPQPAPPPVQQAPAPRPVQPPAPAPSVAWIDAALSAGGWSYRGNGSAVFGPAANPSFVLTCGGGRIRLERHGAPAGSVLTIRTSSEARNLPATVLGGSLVAELAANDPLLDAIAFSRGRFAVEAPGTARLIIPAWPEAARVVEDCRR